VIRQNPVPDVIFRDADLARAHPSTPGWLTSLGGTRHPVTQVQLAVGGSWRLASAELGRQDRETQLTYRGTSRRRPICQDEAEPGAEL
jgi:hypothetical protein